jgi:uncharacterized protein (TIGR04551 family)
MAHALLAALLVVSATATAQTPAPAASPAGPAVAPAAPAAATAPADPDEVRRELNAKLDAAKKEIKEVREEMRAQMATQSAAQGWQEEWVEEKRKLELFVPNGYLRVRPDLFNKFDLGRADDPAGYSLFPRSPLSTAERPAPERTNAGVNMRFRFEPTMNISEEVRIKAQVDALDNVIFGSNPDYAYSRQVANGHAYDTQEFTLLTNGQVAPVSGVNALRDSIALKRVYGEVSTPIGIARFGRMGSQWGLGMLRNDGNCLDCDYGDTVDRLMFVSEPLAGYYVTGMLDFDAEGLTSARQTSGGQPFDLSNADDAHGFLLVAARRDTEQQARAKLDSDQAVFNYGVHFEYRVQKYDPAALYAAPFQGEGGELGSSLAGGYVPRNGSLYIPDVWVKYERKDFRLELEAAAVLGSIGNRAMNADAAREAFQNQPLTLTQFGGVAQGEYRFMNGSLKAQLELGFASGDRAPGFGNYPRRTVSPGDGTTPPGTGDIDGPQYGCSLCADTTINNFRFNRDYRIDMILWREILGSVTDAMYAKPSLSYRVAEGFDIHAAVIYSRAVFIESTPSWNGVTGAGMKGDANLGIEINVGARYETEDGFFATVNWGILFPFGGFADNRLATPPPLDTAQALRGSIGIKY